MLIKIQRNASNELFLILEMNDQSQLKVKYCWFGKEKKLLNGITTKITKECNTLCCDVIAKH